MKRINKFILALGAIALIATGCTESEVKEDLKKELPKKSEEGNIGKKEITESSAKNKMTVPTVGDKAPDLNVSDISTGEEKKLEDLLDKPIILNFFSTSCGPCRAEMPDLNKIYSEYGEKVNIVVITAGESKESIDEFKSELDLNMPIYLDDESNSTNVAYFIRFVPTTYLINQEGIIEKIVPGMMNYSQMEKLVKGE